MKKLLLLPLLGLMLWSQQATAGTPVPTACGGIAAYADAYVAVYARFMDRANGHHALYEQDAGTLTPAEVRIVREDFALLAAELAMLTPPPALYMQWSIEIAYWRLYAGYAEAVAVIDRGYANNAHGMTVSVLANSVVVATQYATASCPVWQDTVDTIKMMTAA